MADYADRSLQVGYVGGSILLFTLLIIALGVWRSNASAGLLLVKTVHLLSLVTYLAISLCVL